MKNLILILLLIFFGLESRKARGQEIPQMDFEQFETWLHKNNDTTYVVNFWATWCKPCVKEIPDFLRVADEMKNEKVRFIFVSLDFPGQVSSSVVPFLEKHGMTDEKIILLDDPDANSWIDEVDSGWSGAIPATLIYNSSMRRFEEGTLTYTKLINILKKEAL